MDPHQVFQLPEVTKYFNNSRANYNDWKYTLFFQLDWFQLRPFVEGSANAPPADATDEERLAYNRNKAMAHAILRDSVYDWLNHISEDRGSYDEDDDDEPLRNAYGFLFDNTYDAKKLWDAIHELIPDDISDF